MKRRLRAHKINSRSRRPIISVGLSNNIASDLYHYSMSASWSVFLAGTFGVFMLLNALFAILYGFGGHAVANAPPGLSIYMLYFSIETLATLGYGDMHPQTHYGHVVASFESFTGLLYAAVITGLLFARFSRPRARLVFADVMTIARYEGRETLSVRVANARLNYIANATAKLWLMRDEVTAEGRELRRFHELRLVRSENPSFFLTWLVLHVIDEQSPLYGLTAKDFEASDVSFVLSIQGRDENSTQDLHAREDFTWGQVRWNMRYVDIFGEADGKLLIDYTLFHDVEPDAR
jgi:inward rectifier potassium channel